MTLQLEKNLLYNKISPTSGRFRLPLPLEERFCLSTPLGTLPQTPVIGECGIVVPNCQIKLTPPLVFYFIF